MKFSPIFSISTATANALVQIEQMKSKVATLVITPQMLKSLYDSAKLSQVHFSTAIEGNKLNDIEVEQTLKKPKAAPRTHDVKEVLGYYMALNHIEQLALDRCTLAIPTIQKIHALVMGGGRTKLSASKFRDGQNVIKEAGSGHIVYLPPEAHDVAPLMQSLIDWLKESDAPWPIKAGIAHYQFATIHPYFDGNGRTARLLTTLLLHLNGYGLKGLYCLEEYYAKDLAGYYDALNVGPSHNYYMGREQADISGWVEYFCVGMAESFTSVYEHARSLQVNPLGDFQKLLRQLNPLQRRILHLFADYQEVTTSQVGDFLGIHTYTARRLCQQWATQNFLQATTSAKKNRAYRLTSEYEELLLAGNYNI